MNTVPLTVSRKEILEEVAAVAQYTADKTSADGESYDAMCISDEDAPRLLAFWDEARAEMCQHLMRVLSSESETGDNYVVALNVSASFDPTLKPSMEKSLHGYFVALLMARWCAYAAKSEVTDYVTRAGALLDDVKQKAFYKKKPVRPTYD